MTNSGDELATTELRSPSTDPRTKPTLAAVMARYGAAGHADHPRIVIHDRDAVLTWVAHAHEGWQGLYESLPNELPGDDARQIETTSHTITAPDGHRIELRISRPAAVVGPLPCAIYVHGGGMTILSAFNKVHAQWREDLAHAGMVVVGVDFRNAWTAEKLNPFPTGLNDCSAALHWVDDNRDALGITRIILTGESGGANLALATALKANRDGQIARVDGVYGVAPTISGAYAWPAERRARELPSLVECDGYCISAEELTLLCSPYDPTLANVQNPLCWPYWASPDDLEGLPPHVISSTNSTPCAMRASLTCASFRPPESSPPDA